MATYKQIQEYVKDNVIDWFAGRLKSGLKNVLNW